MKTVLPSKELLNEVFTDINFVFIQNNIEVRSNYLYVENKRGVVKFKINIHELAHKCKEWAWNKGYFISISKNFNSEKYPKWEILCLHKDKEFEDCEEDDYFHELIDTEPEAIFKACEWILNDN